MIEDAVIPAWKKWMQRTYIPTMKDGVKNLRVELYEVMTVVQEGNTNFSCQLQCGTPADMDTVNKCNGILVNNAKGEFGNTCLTFSSILKEVAPVG